MKKTFVSAVLAGMCIGFGGVAFLSVDNKVLGAVLFTVGLFCVCTFKLNLFTGAVCYFFTDVRNNLHRLPVIWFGNLVGTGAVAAVVLATRIAPISRRAAELCAVKTADSPGSLFLLGILCNIFIYIGVEGFRNNPHEVGKYLALFFGVVVFILCGYEHCIADMFYFSVARAWSADVVLRLVVITLGNAVGGVIFPQARAWLNA